MTVMMIVLGVALAILVFVWLDPWSARRKLRNPPVDVRQRFGDWAVQSGVRWDHCERAVNEIAQAFEIDPRILRPDDSLEPLFALDSWKFGEGADRLGEIAIARFGPTVVPAAPKTVGELVMLLSNPAVRA